MKSAKEISKFIWDEIWKGAISMPVDKIFCNKCKERLHQYLMDDKANREYGKRLMDKSSNSGSD